MTPYNLLLPAKGYAIAWVNLPGYALGDAQTTAEYVAYNIKQLAPHSATGKVAVIGHSQGAGISIQWALLYWPSIQPLVSRYIALAGDFHGTDEGPLACAAEDLLRGGCQASVLQQTSGSKLLAAQNTRGNTALVPTTSIYTKYDEIIQDEIIHPTSILPGADNYALQDLDVCGPLHLCDHFTMVVDPAAYGIALLALGAGSGTTPISEFNSLYCSFFVDDELLNLTAVPKLIESAFDAILQVAGGGTAIKSEPLLKE
ncbi:hypothetical protein HWV62_22959 [Athelia sp. TMB]|nr:hypothetical protein HWV62_22959 [Athelia sp. TMB]